jgi:hypothetical protein
LVGEKVNIMYIMRLICRVVKMDSIRPLM